MRVRRDTLWMVGADTGENGFFSIGEFQAITYPRQMEYVTPEECARLTIAAAAGRQRQVVMTARARVGQWIKLIAPGVVDRIARRAIERGR